MYGYIDLKKQIEISDTTVECPVGSCDQVVRRRRRGDKYSSDFICPVHQLDISPSTFSYPNKTDNMLWTDESDMALFNDIKKVKRENRINANNSEDAVTWNVFRHLERVGLLGSAVEMLTGIALESPRIIYWSWAQQPRDQDANGVWAELSSVRREFGEDVGRDSEPDVIVIGDNGIVFIEAKLTASNSTVPSRPEVESKYTSGGSNWFQQTFNEDFKTIAQQEKLYELLRFWLLGSWLAHDTGMAFCLVNLVLAKRETNIERRFGKHIRENKHAYFVRKTWEDVYRLIQKASIETADQDAVLKYFENHTIGYVNGKLRRAFSIG